MYFFILSCNSLVKEPLQDTSLLFLWGNWGSDVLSDLPIVAQFSVVELRPGLPMWGLGRLEWTQGAGVEDVPHVIPSHCCFLSLCLFRWRAAFLLSLRIPVELLEFYEAFENASQRPFADNFLSFIQPSHLVSKDLRRTGVRRGARDGRSQATQGLLQWPEWRCQVLWKGPSQPQAWGDTLVPPGMLTPFFNSLLGGRWWEGCGGPVPGDPNAC